LSPLDLDPFHRAADRRGDQASLPHASTSGLAARRSRLGAAAAHLVKATERKPVNRQRVAVQAPGALVKRAETA
jgi:hypothetical protein